MIETCSSSGKMDFNAYNKALSVYLSKSNPTSHDKKPRTDYGNY